MAAKKKLLNKGKTKIRQTKEKFSKETRTKPVLQRKTETIIKKNTIQDKISKLTTSDKIQILIIIVLLSYLLFVILKFHEII